MTKLRILALTLVFALVTFSSCKKTPTDIGKNLQPDFSYIKVFTANDNEIVANTQHIDSLLTSTATSLLVGDMYDEIFGTTNLETYIQFTPKVLGQEWGDNAVADSIVLQLCYSGFYGDTTSMQRYVVRELSEAFTDSTKYYSNMVLATNSEALADYTYQPHPLTYSNIDDDTLSKAVLRIPLDNSLGQSFIENPDKLQSVESFLEFFKGLNVKAEDMPGKGAVYFFDATNSYTYMRLYYHNNTDTLTYDFSVTSKNYHYGHFEHDYTTAVAPIKFNDSVDNRYLYVQGVAGVMTWVQFPTLAEWARSLDGNVLINEAKLVLTGSPAVVDGAINDTAVFTPPVQLIVAKRTGDNAYELLEDQYVSAGYFGGQYNNGTVTFRLNRYVQDLILAGPEKENLGLYIFVNAGSYTPRHWVFNGPDNADTARSIRLQLIYSTIKTE